MKRLTATIIFLFMIAGSSTASDLPVAKPEHYGVDGSRLAAAIDKAQQINGLNSLVIVRNGHIISEVYLGNNTTDSLFHVRSITKSVMACLIGIAIHNGHLQHLDQTLDELIGHAIKLDDQQSRLTLRHLLTMSSGFQWDESGTDSYYRWWFQSQDRIGYLLTKPLSDPPGIKFVYNSATAHLLSAVLTETTGTTTLEFANQHLFEPLNISGIRWEKDERGYYNGSAGLECRSRDLAKLGLLYLNNGTWKNQEIIPSDWIKQTRTIHQATHSSRMPSYGYLNWIRPGPPHDVFLSWGWGGQLIYRVPDKDIIVVTTAEWKKHDVSDQTDAIFRLISEDILPFM